MSNYHSSTARDGNPGKLLPSAPPLLSSFWPSLVLFGYPAMTWDHAVSWGRGVWVSDVGRVGHTGSGGWPAGIAKPPRKRVSCCLAWVVVRQNHPCVVNRCAPLHIASPFLPAHAASHSPNFHYDSPGLACQCLHGKERSRPLWFPRAHDCFSCAFVFISLESFAVREDAVFPRLAACVVCELSSRLFWTSGLWTYQAGVTQEDSEDLG